MDDKISRIIKKHYPEIANGWHVPIWAVITTINENIHEGDLGDRYRPRYAASVRLLNKSGDIVTTSPEMQNIAIAGSFNSSGGVLILPEPGNTVELSFAFGDPDKPYVSNVLPWSVTLPDHKPGELTLQSRKGARMHIDNAGNVVHETDRKLSQLAAELEQIIGKMNVSATGRTTNIKSHDKITVGGKYHLEALGALLLLTTGHVELSSLDSMNFTTASDLNENIAGQRRSIIKGPLSLAVKDTGEIKLDENGLELTIEKGYATIGRGNADVVKVLYDLIDTVSQLANALTTHIHPSPEGPTSAPTNAGEIAGQGAQAEALANVLKPIVKQ